MAREEVGKRLLEFYEQPQEDPTEVLARVAKGETNLDPLREFTEADGNGLKLFNKYDSIRGGQFSARKCSVPKPLGQAQSPPMDEQRRKRIVRHHLRCLGRLGVSTGPKRISEDGVVAKPGRQARQKPRSRRRAGNYFRRCHLPVPGYDQLAERRFELIPLWGFLVFLLYSMRRVDCRRCGVVAVEEVPWGDGKRTLTKAYMLFPSPLGAAIVMERDGGGISHILG